MQAILIFLSILKHKDYDSLCCVLSFLSFWPQKNMGSK